jgi:hypothetical protein
VIQRGISGVCVGELDYEQITGASINLLLMFAPVFSHIFFELTLL